jgi:hypothetical protein
MLKRAMLFWLSLELAPFLVAPAAYTAIMAPPFFVFLLSARQVEVLPILLGKVVGKEPIPTTEKSQAFLF